MDNSNGRKHSKRPKRDGQNRKREGKEGEEWEGEIGGCLGIGRKAERKTETRREGGEGVIIHRQWEYRVYRG